jgi:hypothetical protein
MNSGSKLSSSSSRRSWTWIAGVSSVVSVLALGGGFLVLLPPARLLVALFFVGVMAGTLSTRQAWLSGVIVGLPLSLQQLTRYALTEFGTVPVALAHADYWRLVAPVSVVATGVSVFGALAGAWLFGERFRPR